jgi:nucleotide-binding universal stress UspA family protein
MAFTPKQHVIVPVDFSEPSFKALRTARDLVAKSSDLYVIHVLPLLSPMDPGVVWDAWNDGERIQHAKDALLERLDDDLKDVRVEVAIGDPAREITERATKHEADLIVIPSHGRTGAARLFIGSVAERVVRLAHCPVLVLRQ